MSDSDVEIRKIPPMKPVRKPPPSPTEELLRADRKATTKTMIQDALTALKTRKGVSIQAIKKYMEDKYNVNPDKVKYLIKKTLKSGVEDGSIIQVKGIGASGSFKLAAAKEKTKKKLKPKKEKPEKEKSTKEKSKEKLVKETQKIVKEKPKPDKMKAEKKIKIDVKSKEDKKLEKRVKKTKEVKEKGKSKVAGTPKKKAQMMKRKSIGSIIKPPKMKPKSKA